MKNNKELSILFQYITRERKNGGLNFYKNVSYTYVNICTLYNLKFKTCCAFIQYNCHFSFA